MDHGQRLARDRSHASPSYARACEMCPPNTDVTVSAIYKCHYRRVGRRVAPKPRGSAALDPDPN
jgi:hypothetical protein